MAGRPSSENTWMLPSQAINLSVIRCDDTSSSLCHHRHSHGGGYPKSPMRKLNRQLRHGVKPLVDGFLVHSIANVALTTAVTFLSIALVSFTPMSATSLEFVGVI